MTDFKQKTTEADDTVEIDYEGETHVAHTTTAAPLKVTDVERECHEFNREIMEQQREIDKIRADFQLDEGDDPEEALGEEELADYQMRLSEIRPAVSSEKMRPRMELICEHIVEFDGPSWGDNDKWKSIARPHQLTILQHYGTEAIWELYDAVTPGATEDEKNS